MKRGGRRSDEEPDGMKGEGARKNPSRGGGERAQARRGREATTGRGVGCATGRADGKKRHRDGAARRQEEGGERAEPRRRRDCGAADRAGRAAAAGVVRGCGRARAARARATSAPRRHVESPPASSARERHHPTRLDLVCSVIPVVRGGARTAGA